LAVASGKGGVGKTTVAVNLALAPRQAGTRVGLFDADLYGPNVPLLLGVRRKKSAEGYAPVARADPEPYITPLERFGLQVMSIGFVMGDPDAVLLDPRFAGQVIHQTLQDVLWGELDFLLLDFPPGSGESGQTLLSTIRLDGVLIVTTPQDMSLMDACRSLQMFTQAGAPILGVIENMSYLNCPHCGEAVEVFDRSERDWPVEANGLTRLGPIPLDRAISRPIYANHPLVNDGSDSAQALAFQNVAAQVIKLASA
jgi:ATP-binding protein involved in chromosome partitioning